MPFWDKAAKTAKDAAEKATFEGNKLVRIQREQGALNDLRGKAQARLGDLGRLALSLYQNGTLTDPSVAALAQEVADLEAQVNAQQAKIEGIKADQYGSAPGATYVPPASYSPAPTYGAPAQPSTPPPPAPFTAAPPLPPAPFSAAPPPPAPFDAAPPPAAPPFGPANVPPPPAPFNAAPPPPAPFSAAPPPPAPFDAAPPPPTFGPANVAPPPAPTDAPPAQTAETVECPNCHTQVRTNAAFCPECGTRLRS